MLRPAEGTRSPGVFWNVFASAGGDDIELPRAKPLTTSKLLVTAIPLTQAWLSAVSKTKFHREGTPSLRTISFRSNFFS